MKKHSNFMEAAVKEALAGIKRRAGGPFGAVIVKKNKILAKGHNTVIKTSDPTRHAEINVIQKLSRKKKNPFFKGCILYTTTEPCPMCFSALHWGQFKKIIYSTTIHDVKKLGFNELTVSPKHLKKMAKSKVLLQRISSPPARKLLKIWKRLPHKRTY